nr:thiamine pyrophosphate-binding protein [Agrobacterium pusense]
MFGIPGEENIQLVDATAGSKVRFILTRHECRCAASAIAAASAASFFCRLTNRFT